MKAISNAEDLLRFLLAVEAWMVPVTMQQRVLRAAHREAQRQACNQHALDAIRNLDHKLGCAGKPAKDSYDNWMYDCINVLRRPGFVFWPFQISEVP